MNGVSPQILDGRRILRKLDWRHNSQPLASGASIRRMFPLGGLPVPNDSQVPGSPG
jgi:hypothetical protein